MTEEDKLRAELGALDDAGLRLLGLRRIEEPTQAVVEAARWTYGSGRRGDWPFWSELSEATQALWVAASQALDAARKAAEAEAPRRRKVAP